jgi:aminoglycoside 3'-phosphotransferase III
MNKIKYIFNITNKVAAFLESAMLNEIGIGCSDSQVIKIEKNTDTYYLKIAKFGLLTQEYNNLEWLNGRLKVPTIVLYDVSAEAEFLITKAISGEMVCSDYYLENPELGIPVIVEAFKELYKVDITNCPFNVSIKYKLSLVKYNIDNNLIDINNVSDRALEKHKSLEGIYNYLVNNVFKEELCFSHGDISLPNVFACNNKFSGFVDVGECGIADKWFDIAIVEKSIVRNYGKQYINNFYNLLDIVPDQKKIDFYQLLMELYL